MPPFHHLQLHVGLGSFRHADLIAGGDGTVNECVRGLIDKDITLATLPCGSGNGFSLHNNIDTNLDNAIKSLANYKEIKSDVWTINDNPFINVSGTGFDALIANSFSKLKNRGFNSYIKLVLKNVIAYKPQKYSIEIDGGSLDLSNVSVDIYLILTRMHRSCARAGNTTRCRCVFS